MTQRNRLAGTRSLTCTPIACRDCGIYQLCFLASRETHSDLATAIVKQKRVLRRGEYLYRIGESFQAFYALRCGSVKTYLFTDDGRVQVTGFHIAGELLGLDAIATSRHHCEAKVLETTSVCEVPYLNFEKLAGKIPALQAQMLRIMSHMIHNNQEMLLLLGKKNAEERLATYLLTLSQRFEQCRYPPTCFTLSMSRKDIGNYLGLAEETVCRVFTRFQGEGLISIQRKNIQINDLDRLRALSHG